MLAGHLDTMPPGNLSSWQTDPYELTRADDRLAADPGWPATSPPATLTEALVRRYTAS
jgi:hypothetical protein